MIKRAIELLSFRLRAPQNLEEALQRVLSRDSLSHARMSLPHSGCLIEHAAQLEGLSSDDLLAEAAFALKLQPLLRLKLPSITLVSRTGHECARLQAAGAVPQAAPGARRGYAMAVADPGLIDRAEYEVRGIPVYLARRSDIDAVWSRYRGAAGGALSGELAVLLDRLAADAARCGAKEVFLGHPSPESYEFIAEGKRFGGRLAAGIYEQLLAALGTRPQSTAAVSPGPSGLEQLEIALTKNFSHPVLFMSWRQPAVETADGRQTAAAPPRVVPLTLEPERRPAAGEAGSVLLVEDDPRFSTILSRVLQERGYGVHCCFDGSSALAYIDSSEHSPALVISDVHMPGLDGAELLRELRSRRVDVPVVMLTSDEDDLLQIELVALGADAFVRKQDDVRVLLAWCANLLSRRAAALGTREACNG